MADEIAVERGSSVTLPILREVADKYTPTRFKAKFSTIFTDMADNVEQPEAEEQLVFQMEWDQAAQEVLDMVPAEFRSQAVSGTEDYAQKHNYPRITEKVVNQYRKELGF